MLEYDGNVNMIARSEIPVFTATGEKIRVHWELVDEASYSYELAEKKAARPKICGNGLVTRVKN